MNNKIKSSAELLYLWSGFYEQKEEGKEFRIVVFSFSLFFSFLCRALD